MLTVTRPSICPLPPTLQYGSCLRSVASQSRGERRMDPRSAGEVEHNHSRHLGANSSSRCSSAGTTVFLLSLLWSIGMSTGASEGLCGCRDEQVDSERRPQGCLGSATFLPWRLEEKSKTRVFPMVTEGQVSVSPMVAEGQGQNVSMWL